MSKAQRGDGRLTDLGGQRLSAYLRQHPLLPWSNASAGGATRAPVATRAWMRKRCVTSEPQTQRWLYCDRAATRQSASRRARSINRGAHRALAWRHQSHLLPAALHLDPTPAQSQFAATTFIAAPAPSPTSHLPAPLHPRQAHLCPATLATGHRRLKTRASIASGTPASCRTISCHADRRTLPLSTSYQRALSTLLEVESPSPNLPVRMLYWCNLMEGAECKRPRSTS